ncbi:hypothetical protein F2Q69_00054092 [Brassica cretica]|uniref:Uncharacterized protein n=1 Tax=Brassica cretica TaxID=69181 RepID=A0A8S9MT77_BRACR|nr:hypothetical protein F2Q69_00054092 [Brassica cretica]
MPCQLDARIRSSPMSSPSIPFDKPDRRSTLPISPNRLESHQLASSKLINPRRSSLTHYPKSPSSNRTISQLRSPN